MPVFSRTNSILLFLGLAVAALPAAATPAPRLKAAVSATNSEVPAFQFAARKGTRNFRSDDAGAPGAPSASTTPALPDKPAAEADSRTLEGCMATWDKGTHISKSRWREICQRNLNDRGQTEAGAAR